MEWLDEVWILAKVIRPVLDITILAFLIYQGYKILLQSRAMELIKGALVVLVLYGIAYLLQLSTLLWILNALAPGLLIGLVIVFQPELRKIFTTIGKGRWFNLQKNVSTFQVESILSAVDVLSGIKRGCLIVFSRNVGLKNIIDTGTLLNAELSSSLLMTIFSHDTALHDGAVVVQNGRLIAAGCFLPLSSQPDIKRSFGTRHRAALGMAEESDAVVMLVSEETGAVSLAYDANLYYDLRLEEAGQRLKALLQLSSIEKESSREV